MDPFCFSPIFHCRFLPMAHINSYSRYRLIPPRVVIFQRPPFVGEFVLWVAEATDTTLKATMAALLFFYWNVSRESPASKAEVKEEWNELKWIELAILLCSIWWFPEIGVPTKSSILVGLSLINQPFWGTTIYGSPHLEAARFHDDHHRMECQSI